VLMIDNPEDGMIRCVSVTFSSAVSLSAGRMRAPKRYDSTVGNRVFD
jgi:hypothetical protein